MYGKSIYIVYSLYSVVCLFFSSGCHYKSQKKNQYLFYFIFFPTGLPHSTVRGPHSANLFHHNAEAWLSHVVHFQKRDFVLAYHAYQTDWYRIFSSLASHHNGVVFRCFIPQSSLTSPTRYIGVVLFRILNSSPHRPILFQYNNLPLQIFAGFN